MGRIRHTCFLPLPNPLSVTQDIKVFVVRKFFVPNVFEYESLMHIIIRDGQGNCCEAEIQPYLVPKFDSVIKTGFVYFVSQLSLVEKNYFILSSVVPFMVMFNCSTEILSTTGDEFDKSLYHDSEYALIKNVNYDTGNVVFDVFGAVVDCVDLPFSGNESRRVLVLVEGLGNQYLRVVLMDSYYVQFKSYVDHIWDQKNAFYVILHLFRPVLWNGDVVLESCKFMSDLIIDQAHPQVYEYHKGKSCCWRSCYGISDGTSVGCSLQSPWQCVVCW